MLLETVFMVNTAQFLNGSHLGGMKNTTLRIQSCKFFEINCFLFALLSIIFNFGENKC